MKKIRLLKGLAEYIKYCCDKKEPDTFRGLLGFLADRGMGLDYFEANDMGLMDFNNALVDCFDKSIVEDMTNNMKIKAHGSAIDRLERMMMEVYNQLERISKALNYLDKKI